MKKWFLIIILKIVLTTISIAQDFVEGKIYDQINHAPLSGAHIRNLNDAVTSDANGSFHLPIRSLPCLITVSFIGYETRAYTVDNLEPISILLAPNDTELNQVIVSSGLSSDKIINISTSISLINQQQFQRDQAFSLSNSFNRVPGVFMHAGTLNTNRITIRGIGSRSLFATDKIKAYCDQIPLTDGSGNSTLEDLDQSLIERIEIIKGPNSSVYGAGLGGVIQIRSLQPTFNQTSFSSGITVGSFGTIRLLEQVSHSSDKLDLNMIYSKLNSDGWRENNNFEKWQTGVTARYYLNNEDYLSFIGVFTDLNSQIPSSLGLDAFNNSPKSAATNWKEARGYEDYRRMYGGIGYHYQIKDLSISHALTIQHKDAYEPAPRPVNIIADQTIGFSTRNVLDYSSEKWVFSGGFEWFGDQHDLQEYNNLHSPTSGGSLQGELLNKLKENRSYVNVFSEVGFKPSPKLKMVAGLNFNKTNYKLNDLFVTDGIDISGNYGFNSVWSPRIGAVFHLHENAHLFANVSHGFSPPNLEETLYPDGQINPNIQPETGWNFEAGSRGEIKGLSYDVAIYFMDIKNLLVSQRTINDEYIGINAGRNFHLGSDINLIYKKERSKGIFQVYNNMTMAHFRFKKFIDSEIDYSGNKLTGVPAINMATGLEWISNQGFYGNINSQYTGRMPITDDNALFSDSYLILRSKAGYKTMIGTIQIDLNAGIDNITDKHYASMLLINTATSRFYYPGLPRNFYTSLALKWKIK